MHALVTAGGTPAPDDPLYAAAQGKPRALIDVAGKPMIQWVLDALCGADSVDDVVIAGLGPEDGLACAKPLYFLEDRGGMLGNALAGLERVRQLDPSATHTLYSSCDIPTITAEMVEWRVRTALEEESDFDFAAVERAVMEARFPDSRRTYVKLKDAEVCGGDLNVIRVDLVANEKLWNRLIAARKSVLRQAALLGFDTLLLILFRRLSLKSGEQKVSRRLNIKGRLHLSPYAEIGMDVDKPHQLELVRRDLSRGAGAGP